MLIGPLPTPGIAYLTRTLRLRLRHRHQRFAQSLRRQRHQVLRRQGGKLSDEVEEAIEAELERGPITRSSMNLGRAQRVDKSRRHVPGLLRRIAAQGHDARGHEARGRLRQWRRLQGGAAHARRSRRGDHSDRLFAQRPQHQRWLRLDLAGTAAAHRARRARRRRASRSMAMAIGSSWSTAWAASSTAINSSTSSRPRASAPGCSRDPWSGR